MEDDGAILSRAWLPPELPCAVHALVPGCLTTYAGKIMFNITYSLKTLHSPNTVGAESTSKPESPSSLAITLFSSSICRPVV